MTIGDVAINRLITQQWPYGTAPLVFYVRPTGSDTNNGTSALTAFATFPRAQREMNLYSVNQPVIIDITGMDGADAITITDVLNLGGDNLGGISFDRDVTVVPPGDLFFSRRHRQIRAELQLIQNLTITSQALDATTGLLTLTVSNVLVANALRGLFAISAVLGEYGTIQGNSGGAGPNTITVACSTTFSVTAGAGAYAPGGTIVAGNAGNFFEGATYLNALCDWGLQGIYLSSGNTKTAAIQVWPNAPVDFIFCDIEGINLKAGAGTVTIESCYLHDYSFIHDGAEMAVYQSCLREMTFLCHGSTASGINEWQATMFDLCGTFGGGNVESRYTFEMQRCQVNLGTDEGVSATFGNSRMQDCKIQNCSKSAITATGPVHLTLTNVDGTGNTGYGVEAYLGAFITAASTTSVTGSTNDVYIGDLGATTWAAVTAAPGSAITDVGQLVRVSR